MFNFISYRITYTFLELTDSKFIILTEIKICFNLFWNSSIDLQMILPFLISIPCGTTVNLFVLKI